MNPAREWLFSMTLNQPQSISRPVGETQVDSGFALLTNNQPSRTPYKEALRFFYLPRCPIPDSASVATLFAGRQVKKKPELYDKTHC